MKDITAYLLNYTAPSAGFSLGRLKDNPGDNTGSVVGVATHNDFLYGFYAVILKYLGAVSDTDESESASDMRDALERMAGTVGAKTHIASYNYNQDDVVYREGVIWRANADINTGVDGTTFLLQYAAGKWDSQVSLPDREEIYGGAVTINGVDTQHDVDFASLTCFDITSGDILSGSALTKQIDAAWTVGTNAGMMDTGTVAVSSTYYLHAIKKDSDSSVDYLMSLSSSSPTMPTGYTMKRNIARLITDASANISRIEKVLNPGTKLINEQDIEVTGLLSGLSGAEITNFIKMLSGGNEISVQLVDSSGNKEFGTNVRWNGTNYILGREGSTGAQIATLFSLRSNGEIWQQSFSGTAGDTISDWNGNGNGAIIINPQSAINQGINRTSDGAESQNFYADGAAGTTISAQVQRATGTNGALSLSNRGTGAINFNVSDLATLALSLSSAGVISGAVETASLVISYGSHVNITSVSVSLRTAVKINKTYILAIGVSGTVLSSGIQTTIIIGFTGLSPNNGSGATNATIAGTTDQSMWTRRVSNTFQIESPSINAAGALVGEGLIIFSVL